MPSTGDPPRRSRVGHPPGQDTLVAEARRLARESICDATAPTRIFAIPFPTAVDLGFGVEQRRGIAVSVRKHASIVFWKTLRPRPEADGKGCTVGSAENRPLDAPARS
ncbi:hypothetical protein RJ55_07301 [Drechmeria coniospora]|nr:hypothetical protein RJ55_07301 [Drechmeria coniospora]